MRQKDIIIIIVTVFVAGVASYFISTKIFTKAEDKTVQVKTVEAINVEFSAPDKKYFNEGSLNPTQTITIGTPADSPNTQPTQ